jgi:hypothetical protein
MHGGLEATGQGLAELVARGKQPLAMSCARSVEVSLLRVWAIVGKLIFS